MKKLFNLIALVITLMVSTISQTVDAQIIDTVSKTIETQKVDTLEVSNLYTTYIQFPMDLKGINHSDDENIRCGVCLNRKKFIRICANKPFTRTSNLAILDTQGNLHTFYIKYKEEPETFHYYKPYVIDEKEIQKIKKKRLNWTSINEAGCVKYLPGIQKKTNIDTLKVSTLYATYLRFAHQAEEIECSDLKNFSIAIMPGSDNHIVHLRAKETFTRKLNISIIDSEDILHTYVIVHDEHPTKTYYDDAEDNKN